MPESKWTPEQDKQLLALAGEGKTYAEIAETMNRTKGGIRNRLSRVRHPENVRHRIIIDNMSAEAFGELLRAKERLKDLDRAIAYGTATFEDYKRLYILCEKLLKAYKNHRNTKTAFEHLEREMLDHFPCSY